MPPLPPLPQSQHPTGHGDNTDRLHPAHPGHPGVPVPNSQPLRPRAFYAGNAGKDATQPDEHSVANFFGEALDGALALVRADGGDIATLDETRQVLVLRARHSQPHIDSGVGQVQMGPPNLLNMPSSSGFRSQPNQQHPGATGATRAAEYSGLHDEVDEIEVQSTQLLPATLTTRIFHKGERLIGHCWEKGEPVFLSRAECAQLPGKHVPADPDAEYYLAVPIYRPQSLLSLHAASEVIGVIAVYIRDPRWHFRQQDKDVLQLHADRVARAMRGEELARQNQSQTELLNLLDLEEESRHGAHAVFRRLQGVVRRMIEAPAFAILRYDSAQKEVTIVLAEHDDEPANLMRLPVSRLPWWGPVASGQTICVSAPEERALHPEYCQLGWEEDPPVSSILAAPLIFQNSFLGAIVAGSPRADVYAPEHAHLFTAISRSAAVVVQNALLAERNQQVLAKTHKKEQQLALLNNAVLTLNASLDLNETVLALAKQAAALSGLGEAIMCVVLLKDKDEAGDYLIDRAANRPLPQPLQAGDALRIPLGWRGMRSILNDGQFALLDNLDTEWSDDSEIGRALAARKMVSCLVLPLIQNRDQLGILVAYTPTLRHHFTSEEVGLLQGVASQGAVAINNAKLYQQLQEAYTKQKELDRLKDEFILTVSHEFRTPVTAIEGYVTLISRHGHKLEQTKLDQFASEIHQATSQLMGMINMLHEANSMSDKPLELIPYPVEVHAIAEQAIGLQSPEAKARLRLEINDNYWVLADGERLLHVFTNLISNAIKYSPAEMSCQITAQKTTRKALAEAGRTQAMSAKAPEQWLVIGVRDHGEGIATEDMSKLFQKFVRLPRSLTTSVRGTGLGLWICKQYVDAMGGDIWVESTYGTFNSGSYFQFSLPLTQPPANP